MKFRTKPVQLVRNMSEVMNGYHKRVDAGSHHMVQVKEDGVYSFAFPTGDDWQCYSRTGKPFTNCEVLQRQIQNCCDPDYVHIFEITEPSMSLESLSGIINTLRVKPVDVEFTLKARMHDIIPVESFVDGYCGIDAETRYKLLRHKLQGTDPEPDISLISTLFNRTEPMIRLIAEGVIAKGLEGIVIKEQEADWKAGRKQHGSMKIVRGCDYDLRCVAVEEGEGKRQGMVANVICEWKLFADSVNPIIRIPVDLGKGFSDERRIELYKNPDLIVGHIVEVHALQLGSQGRLRIPKVNSIKIDKTESDV